MRAAQFKVSEQPRRNRGISMLEVLVALLVGGFLFAILLPATRTAGEAARRSQCKNNLKQIGLALHNYHETYNCFPPGYTVAVSTPSSPDSSTPPQLILVERIASAAEAPQFSWTWSSFLLSYMDQAPLSAQLRPEQHEFRSFVTSPNGDALRTRLGGSVCPSSTTPPCNPAKKLVINPGLQAELASSNYVGVNGVWGLFRHAAKPSNSKDVTSGASGAFYENSHVGFREMRDGTSNVVIVGERTWQLTESKSYPFEAATLYGMSPAVDTLGETPAHVAATSAGGLPFALGACLTKINDESSQATANHEARQSFSSVHTGGTHFLMGDGSVRFIGQNINHVVKPSTAQLNSNSPLNSTLEYLCGINDGNPLDNF